MEIIDEVAGLIDNAVVLLQVVVAIVGLGDWDADELRFVAEAGAATVLKACVKVRPWTLLFFAVLLELRVFPVVAVYVWVLLVLVAFLFTRFAAVKLADDAPVFGVTATSVTAPPEPVVVMATLE